MTRDLTEILFHFPWIFHRINEIHENAMKVILFHFVLNDLSEIKLDLFFKMHLDIFSNLFNNFKYLYLL